MHKQHVGKWHLTERASQEKHGVYELVPVTAVPAGQSVIGTRRVTKVKADGT